MGINGDVLGKQTYFDTQQNHPAFGDPDVSAELAELRHKFCCCSSRQGVQQYCVFVCKTHYFNCLIQELGISATEGNPTYRLTTLSREEILLNHNSVICYSKFLSLMKNLIFLNYIGFLNCTRIHTNNATLRAQQWKKAFRSIATPHTQEAVSNRCGSWKSPKSSYKIYNHNCSIL